MKHAPAAVFRDHMTEEQLLRLIIDLARIRGWRTAHFRPARTAGGGWRTPVTGDARGWPDLILARRGRVIAAELKSWRGRLGPGQREWLDALDGCAVTSRVWRPKDINQIDLELR